jgi:CheY-like chemotaxis protein
VTELAGRAGCIGSILKAQMTTAFLDHATGLILIVDPDTPERQSLGTFLRRFGFEVLEAIDPHDALETVAALGNALDLVLADVNLSDNIDGFELAKRVRRLRPLLPFVLTSNDHTRHDAQRARSSGERFAAKPYNHRKLAGRCRQIIDAARAYPV